MANSGAGSIKEFRKKVSKTYDSISTAYHESGHTIYGLLYLIKIESVFIYEDKKVKRIHGITYYDSPELNKITHKDGLSDRIYAEIGLSYAGLVAEKYQFKLISGSDKFPSFLKDGSADDTLEASALIKKYNMVPPGRKRYEFKKNIIKNVGVELQNNWDAVTLIAHALFQKKQLNFLEIKNILIKKSKKKKFWKEQFKKISVIYLEDGTYKFPKFSIS